MHRKRVMALNEIRFVPVTGKECFQFFVWDTRQDGGICDFVAVEVQHRQNGSIPNRIQKFIRMPGSRQRTGFRLTVAYRHGDDKIRIVESCPVRVRNGVAKLTAFVNRPGRLRSAVRAYPSRKRELAEKFEHAGFIGTLVWINLRVMAFEIAVGKRGGRTMAGPGHVEDIQVVFLDEPVQMDPNKGLARIGSPVAKEPILDVLWFQRFAKKGVCAKIDHSR